MEKTSQTFKNAEWQTVIVGIALFLGGILRILPGVMAGFPINDGGMFYVMINDLRSNHYLLPEFTTYNLSNIPFAYPPVGFYLAAVLRGFGVPELEALRWLPVLFNIISIFALYLAGCVLLENRPRAALAAAFYALTPGGFGWFIMGGGLTRALGGLFLLLSVYFLYRVFERGTWKDIALATLSCAVAVLSHPEAGLHTAASCALVWIFWGRTRRGIMHAAIIGLGAVVLTSPWWLTVLAGHGIGPFISAFHTGLYGSPPLSALVSDFFSRNSYIPVLTVLRVAGLVWALWKRKFFLVAWMALPYFVEPRSAAAVSFYPFSMLAALGLLDGFPALLQRLKKKEPGQEPSLATTETKWVNLSVLTILFYLFIESAFFTFPLVNTTLRSPATNIMAWIKRNTPDNSRFLVLSGDTGAMVDPLQEWFPALAERRSQTTLQGLEWTLAEGFVPRLNALSSLQTCEQLACLEDWSKETGLDFTHLLVKRSGVPADLLVALKRSDYEVIHEDPEFVVYRK
jgi:hypothetical protein